jgi:hypothetical protein
MKAVQPKRVERLSPFWKEDFKIPANAPKCRFMSDLLQELLQEDSRLSDLCHAQGYCP